MAKRDEPIAVVPVKQLRELQARAAEATAPGERATMRKAGNEIRFSPTLQPWMMAYAEWLTLACPTPPKRSMRTAKVRSLSRMVVSDGQLRLLEAREDFAAYCVELQRGPLEAARQRYLRTLPDYVDARYEALHQARLAGDYKAVKDITESAIDRVMPKKAEAIAATAVHITLSPAQAQAMVSYDPPPMLVQEVTPEPDDTTDDAD